ncbi:DUF6291 domain-containing protein [Treponema pectinovorum]|uniref:DUF6291 domain-containing protein n=1 Tax=Treponema pectinovorum TaxID=164 RepID=UPI0011C713A1|nr:DUF6291 domain-containing protein [Treponema pectinovorum]
MNKGSFVFYKGYADALKDLLEIFDSEKVINVFLKLCDYAIDEKEIDFESLNGAEKMFFHLVLPSVNSATKRYEASKRGAKKTNEIKTAPTDTQKTDTDTVKNLTESVKKNTETVKNFTDTVNFDSVTVKKNTDTVKNLTETVKNFTESLNVNVNDNDNVNVNLNDNVNLNVNENVNEKEDVNVNVNVNVNGENEQKHEPAPQPQPQPTANHQPPLFYQVNNFCREQRLTVDPNKFFTYYEERGWQYVTDWKRLLLNWQTNQWDRSVKKAVNDDDDPYKNL